MSGRYLVSEVRHLIQRPKTTPDHVMTLVCIKDSVANAYGDKNTYPGTEQKPTRVVDLYEDEQARVANQKTIKPPFLS